MATNALETVRASAHGSIARIKNTRRFWVPPSMIATLDVTGTWVLDVNTNVVSLITSDVGGDGELLYIPYTGWVSDLAVEKGQSAVDRGVRIIGLEVMYEVAASALADADLFIIKTTIDADGDGSAAAVTATQSADDEDATPVEIDDHRVFVTVAERDRFFLDSGTIVHGILDLADGTSSDVSIVGAFWHVEIHEE